MALPIFISNPPPGFSAVAILRGFQLAILGGFRSLQNPKLFKTLYYRQAGLAISISVIIQLVLWSPILLLRVLAEFIGLFTSLQSINSFALALKSFQFNVLNISVFVISASRYFSADLDNLFLSSLEFIDLVYLLKHPEKTAQQYHSNLVALSSKEHFLNPSWNLIKAKYTSSQDFAVFIQRYFKNWVANLTIFFLGRLPYVGSLILGLISIQNLNDKIGTVRALVVFGVLQILPKYYSVMFLNAYWGSRSMVHDLLLPYFSRVRFTKIEKDQWIKSREGLLFGFGFCYFMLIKRLPWIGLLTYGFAESSVAYLITKVSDPPPSQVSQLVHWNASQLVWNKEKEIEVLSGHTFEKDEGFHPLPGSYLFT